MKFAAAFLAVSLLLSSFASPLSAQAAEANARDRADQSVRMLETWFHWGNCHWYEPWTWGQICSAGVWAPTLGWGWWNSANALTATIEYTTISGDPAQLPLIHHAYSSRRDTDYVARNFTDDEGWWALAWLDAYDHIDRDNQDQRQRYLRRAAGIFSDMASYWDNHCGGGIWWQKSPKSYKNSIANELFLAIAAKLYQRTGDERYLGWARAEYHWYFSQTQLAVPGQLIVDGLNDASCQVVQSSSATWTYNQGVVIGALIELGQLDQAKEIATTALHSAMVSPQGILTETSEYTSVQCKGGDCEQFKGIFIRNLMYLYQALPAQDPDRAAYGAFIQANADSVWPLRNTAWNLPRFSVHWGSADPAALNAGSQRSAVDLFIAAMALEGGRPLDWKSQYR